MAYALQNKNAFNFDLKLLMFVERLMSRGNSFHNFGAATENDLSPHVTSFDLGTQSKNLSDDLMLDLVGTYTLSKLLRYTGDWLCKDLKVNNKSLN